MEFVAITSWELKFEFIPQCKSIIFFPLFLGPPDRLLKKKKTHTFAQQAHLIYHWLECLVFM